MNLRSVKQFFIAMTAASLLAGCGMTSYVPNQSALAVPPVQPGHFMSGVAHGGYGTIAGATVTMWAAGTTSGYGQGATMVTGAQTTTDSNGNFSFNTGGASPCTAGQYLYITVTGGNAAAAGPNMALALMAALPNPCVTGTGATATGSQYVVVNEVSTVAAVWALQQFMSIQAGTTYAGGTTPVWNIGAPATNVVGLKNAFAMTAQLQGYEAGYASSGFSGTSTVLNTVTNPGTSTPVTYSTLITPDFNRINAVADILAACVDTTDVTPGTTPSALCTSIFNNTYASGETAPIDTIQEAYKIAVAPAGISKAGLSYSSAWSSSSYNTSWAQYMCGTYVTGTPPFTTALPCSTGNTSTTVDFAIGVRWSVTDNDATYGYKYTACNDAKNINDIVIDAQGNIWGSPVQSYYSAAATSGTCGYSGTSPAGSANYYMEEYSPDGRLLQADPLSTATINTANQGETLYLYAHDAGTTTISGTNTMTTASWKLNSTNQDNNAAIDLSGNYWFGNIAPTASPGSFTASSTTYYQSFLATMTPATNTTCSFIPCTAATTSTAGTVGAVVSPSYPGAMAFDGQGNIWMAGNWANVGSSTAKSALIFLPPSPNASGVPLYNTQYQATATFSSNSFNDVAIDGIGGQTGQFGSTSSSSTGWVGHTAWAAVNASTGTELYRSTVTSATKATVTTAGNAFNVVAYGASGDVMYHATPDANGNVWVAQQNKGNGSLTKFSLYTTPTGFSVTEAANNYYTMSSVSNAPPSGFLNTNYYANTSVCMQGWSVATTTLNNVCGYIPSTTYTVTNGNPATFTVYTKPLATVTGTVTETTGTMSSYMPAVEVTGSVSTTDSGITTSGGLQTPVNVAIDGIGNIWVANAVASISGISEYTPTGLPISPTTATAVTGVSGFNANNLNNGSSTLGSIQKITIDLSGNVFFNPNNSYIGFLVGAAAPVIAPAVMATTSGVTAISGWTASGTAVTFSTPAGNNFAVGDTVTLFGFTSAAASPFNYAYTTAPNYGATGAAPAVPTTVTAVSGTSFTTTVGTSFTGTSGSDTGYVIDYTQPGRLAQRP
jgi:hypothetical protein